jgi:hypothetical protein
LRLLRTFLAPLLIVTALSIPLAAARWDMLYFYDEDRSALSIVDITFPSATRGIAIGSLNKKGNTKPTALVTSDGGKTWTFVPVKEPCVSLFFLDEANGWMVTTEGIWFTDESGRSWKKIRKQKNLMSVAFVTPEHGWAVGLAKAIIETKDGGKTWTKVEPATKVETTTEFTAYNLIEFVNKKTGIIIGRSHPPSWNDGMPAWLDSDAKRRERPNITLFFETQDAGEHWAPEASTIYGQITSFRVGANNRGLGLVEFQDPFPWSSEVIRIDLKTGKSSTALRRKDRTITDIALTDDAAFAAAIEPSGSVAHSPIPMPVKVLRSGDLTTWTDMDVDYRATATRVMITAIDSKTAWLATDTGMILKLRPE